MFSLYGKENYNSAKVDGAGNYLFTKTLNPLQYFNWNFKLPQLQPNITTKLPFQDDLGAGTVQMTPAL